MNRILYNPFVIFVFVLVVTIYSLKNPWNLILFFGLFLLLYVVLPAASFYGKRTAAVRKLKAVCKARRYQVVQQRTLRRQKSLAIMTPDTAYLVTMYSVFRSWLNVFVKSDSAVVIENHRANAKFYNAPNKYKKPYGGRVMSYEYDPGHRMVETFPESHGTTTQKNLRCHAFETIERGCRECDKILMIYPSVQEVFYEVENLKEPMYNGCRVGNTTLYSLKGFCELLNGQTAEVRDAGIGEALS